MPASSLSDALDKIDHLNRQLTKLRDVETMVTTYKYSRFTPFMPLTLFVWKSHLV